MFGWATAPKFFCWFRGFNHWRGNRLQMFRRLKNGSVNQDRECLAAAGIWDKTHMQHFFFKPCYYCYQTFVHWCTSLHHCVSFVCQAHLNCLLLMALVHAFVVVAIECQRGSTTSHTTQPKIESKEWAHGLSSAEACEIAKLFRHLRPSVSRPSNIFHVDWWEAQ